MLTSMTTSFSGMNAVASIAFSKVGRSKDCPIKRSYGAVSNASTPYTCFCDHGESHQRKRARRGLSNAVITRSVPVFSISWLRQHRRSGGADHDDVQSHGRKAPMAVQRSLRQDHGFLPYASRTRGAAAGDLR